MGGDRKNRSVEKCKRKTKLLLASLRGERMKMKEQTGMGKGEYFIQVHEMLIK
jgi:hypothetical protein